MKEQLTRSSVIPAALMAAVVFFVFFTLQNYGPESAVRRFHEGVLDQSYVEIDDVILRPSNPNHVGLLEMYVANHLAQGAQITLHDVERAPTSVSVSVVYHAPNTLPASVTWATQKTEDGWKVDVDRTLYLWRQQDWNLLKP